MFKVKGLKRRAEAALKLEESDVLPVFEIGITLPIVSKIIGRAPFYRNPGVCLEEYAKGKHKEVNRRIALDELECHRKLGFDVIRVSCGAVYYSLPANVVPRKISENTWLINGMRYKYLPNTNVVWQLDSVLQQQPKDVVEHVREHWSEIKEIPEGALEPLEFILKEADNEMLVINNREQ